jgi:putative DNA methylase
MGTETTEGSEGPNRRPISTDSYQDRSERRSCLFTANLRARQEQRGEKIVEPIAYLWTRTVPCSDKKCGATVPLVRQTWLCRKAERSIALRMVPDRAARRVRFEVVSAESPDALGFDPADHSERGDAECPLCGATIDADKVKEYGKAGLIGQQLMAVVGIIANERGRVYLPAEMVPFPSSAELECRQEATGELWPGTAAIKLPEDARSFWPYLYGLDSFDKFFLPDSG